MKLGVVSPGPTDGTSFYRCFGVLGPMAKASNFELITGDVWSWAEIIQCDALFVQRPFNKAHRHVVEEAVTMNIPVWLDYDDDFLGIPRSNLCHADYVTKATEDNMRAMCKMAKLVTVSTEALGRLFEGSVVVPNALNDYMFGLSSTPREKIISWRGAQSHWEDMEPYMRPIRNLAIRNEDWQWHFLGHPHWGVDTLPQERTTRHQFDDNMFGYMRNLISLHPSIHIVTLTDNQFNHCKSNCAWIEATQAGAMVVAPDWEEWQRPGIVTYQDEDDFEAVLTQAIAMSAGERESMVGQSRQYISEFLRLSQVNVQRAELLNGLFKK